MKRISRQLTVPLDQRYRVLEPVAEVDLGETFVVETINCRTPIIRTPEDANPEHYREREETGPIYINGINPGDVLAIHIGEIQPEGHASGGWWEDPSRNSFLEIKGDQVLFPGGLSSRKSMMIGDIYVTPSGPCNNPDDNGGNMDFKDIAPGNTLLLKAQRPGGLLVLGDVHAVQGDGEILGLGAECAAEVRLQITRDERFLPVRPLIVKPGSFICLGCHQDYAQAVDQAAQDAKKILSRLTGCTEAEAYLFVTTVGDLRNGAIWPMRRTEAWARSMPLVVGLEVPMMDVQGA
jgi:amidase